jgi:hypothetical protein
MKNVVILPQTLPLQTLPVLPLQTCISFVLLSLFRSRGRPIEHGTLITSSIEYLNVSFLFNTCTDGSSDGIPRDGAVRRTHAYYSWIFPALSSVFSAT